MKRYDKTERIGVNVTDRIVTNDLDWIFREQPIIDVGLDAIIEKVENGEPEGKFLAVQIKTGEGNFYRTDKNLTYYVSHIHYNYWITLSIPIIIVAHLPNENETYWTEISEDNFKKSRKKWKLDIPLNQKLNKNSKNRLAKLFSEKNDENFDIFKGQTEITEYDFIENISCLREATSSIFKINDLIVELTTDTVAFNDKLHNYIEQKLSNKDLPVIAAFKAFGKTLNISSKRLENEIEIYSQLYSEGVLAVEVVLANLKAHKINLSDINVDFTTVNQIPEMINFALNHLNKLKTTVSTLPTEYPVLKEARKQYFEVLEFLIFEFENAKKITQNLILTIES